MAAAVRPRSGDDASAEVVAHVEAPVGSLGLAAPPHVVAFRLLPSAHGGATALVHAPMGSLEDARAWLEAAGSRDIALDAARGVLRGRFPVRDLKWHPLLLDHPLVPHTFSLESCGRATFLMRGTRDGIREGLAGLPRALLLDLSSRPAAVAPDLLTDRQAWVLAEALARGYYDVPKRVKARAIARELGMSDAGLSETLRRGEANLVRAYLAAKHPAPAPPFAQATAQPAPVARVPRRLEEWEADAALLRPPVRPRDGLPQPS